jgi:acetylornithine deacetylase/succinyl-diaminopimelate desuccinylase family protein
MPTAQEKVLSQLDQLDVVPLLSMLVSHPSFRSEEATGTQLRDYMRSLGLETGITEIEPGRFNVLAHLGPPGRRLILNTHMDTVPPGDEASWQRPPFSALTQGGRLYGRGACDAKGSLAAMTLAVEALVRSGIRLQGRVTLMAVAYEETGALGSIRESQKLSRDCIGVIIGEPTGLELHLAHKGVLRMDIDALGRSAHASTPAEGLNAISLAASTVKSLDTLGANIAPRHHPLVGYSTLSVTAIEGGIAPNVVPDHCKMIIDRRLIPGESLEEAQLEIESLLHSLQATTPGAKIESEVRTAVPSAQTAADDPFVVAIQGAGQLALGLTPQIGGFAACCDMWAFREKGIPTVIFGPGNLSQAHIVDEWVDLAEVSAAARFYALAALGWLGSER